MSLQCKANSALELAGNAISQLSYTSLDFVLEVLDGTSAPEPGSILDCITDDLTYMRQRISTIFDEVVPSLESSIQTYSK